MDVGIVFANVLGLGRPDGAAALAEACDAHGVESVWTVEHVVVPSGYESRYPYSESGKMPGPEDSDIPDPLIWLTYVAARSERVKVATGVLLLPERNPVVLAKEVATLDVLSRGRAVLGVGVGWLREEFEALGVPFERRGRRTDEHIEALRELWTAEEPTYEGELVRFRNARSHPKPVQPTVPIVVGGHSEAAARRAGRLGDGFFPNDPAALPHLIEVMRASAEQAGRDPDAIEITTGAGADAQENERLRALGVSRVVVPPPGFGEHDIGPGIERMMDGRFG